MCPVASSVSSATPLGWILAASPKIFPFPFSSRFASPRIRRLSTINTRALVWRGSFSRLCRRRRNEMPTYLTQQDLQNFGPEMLDLAQRASLHAVAPHLQELEQQNAELHARLMRQTKRAFNSVADMYLLVGNYVGRILKVLVNTIGIV